VSGAVDVALDDQALTAALAELRAVFDGPGNCVDALEHLIRTGSDRALVRIGPSQFALDRDLDQSATLRMFLHARKLGLVTMEWQFVCPGCGEVVDSLASLTSATAHFFCQVCSTDRSTDLSDGVEVTFKVAPSVRRSSYLDPWSLDPEAYFFEYRFCQSGMVDGQRLVDHLRRCAVRCCYVEAGATETIEVDAEPEYLWFTNGPALSITPRRTETLRRFEFEYSGTHTAGFRLEIPAGPVRIDFTNLTAERYALMVANLPGEYDLEFGPRVTGADVLSNQTFLDLFPRETILASEGLQVQRLALMFTDLQGSTALYDRMGDMKAFDLVRLHFGYLRECVSRHSGAVVKTIGDAVMATFLSSADAVRAARHMHASINDFNQAHAGELIGLKIGIHWGACLAVTLNDHLDYFGQTVNVAARVQALAGAHEIVVTDAVLGEPGVIELTADLAAEASAVSLKGVASAIVVHHLREPSRRISS
jgi:class 3 adenylate cyclase